MLQRKSDRQTCMPSACHRRLPVKRRRAVAVFVCRGVKASHKHGEPNIHIHDASEPQCATEITAIPREQPRKTP